MNLINARRPTPSPTISSIMSQMVSTSCRLVRSLRAPIFVFFARRASVYDLD